MTTPSIISLILLGGTLGFMGYGAWRGAIRQVGSVAAFLLGFLCARLFGPEVSRLFDLPPLLCYAVVFAVVFVVVVLLARVLKLTVKMLLLGPVDRLIGALIGAGKWLIGATVIMNLYLLCDPSTQLFSSRPAQWTVELLPRLFGLAQTYFPDL